jgi:nucleoside-diphosphate-sugar epimerase
LVQNHVLIAGASGVIGAGAVEHFCGLPGWQVTGLARREPVVGEGAVYQHIAVDLADRAACAAAVAALPPVTHLIYAAVAEAPGLVSGWYDQGLIERNGRMFANLLDPLAAAKHLQHASLLQGTKAYGGHHHTVALPCRERQPRDEHSNFYWLHEDHLRLRAKEAGFTFTVFRPQVLLGAAAGVAMNPVAALGAYAALTAELELPFAFPGKGEAMWEMVDTGLLAEALAWAAEAPLAADQIFNITNGDVLVLAHDWQHLAAALGLESGGVPPVSLAGFFAEARTQEAWGRLAARHGLRVPNLVALLGESHHYLDLLLSPRLSERPLPMLLSTIKLRRAGFGACRDSLDSLLHWLGRMVELKLLPPLGAMKEIKS